MSHLFPFKRQLSAILVTMAVVRFVPLSYADHPQILVSRTGRESLVIKLRDESWARDGFAAFKARLDPWVERTQTVPAFVSSRLLMNWDTHYTTPLIAKSMSVGGEGKASLPTPRFAGERNWASDYSRPKKLEDWLPYNDRGGKVYLQNSKTGQMDWVEPRVTGRTFELGNEQIMRLAAEAGFVYFVTGRCEVRKVRQRHSDDLHGRLRVDAAAQGRSTRRKDDADRRTDQF